MTKLRSDRYHRTAGPALTLFQALAGETERYCQDDRDRGVPGTQYQAVHRPGRTAGNLFFMFDSCDYFRNLR